MSITKFKGSENPFVMIPNDTARDKQLKPSALGLLTFLASHATDWEIQDNHLRRHFGIGRDALRSIFRNLEVAGYLKRRKIRTDKGRFTMETSISVYPEYGLPVGGLPTSGLSVGGKPTDIQRNIYKEKVKKERVNNKPAKGGKPQSGSKSNTFAKVFGTEFPINLMNHIDEEEAVALAVKFKLDEEDARKLLGELSAMAVRGFKKDPRTAWVWLCRERGKVVVSALGEKNMPQWAEVSI
jgi:hypothetical protein